MHFKTMDDVNRMVADKRPVAAVRGAIRSVLQRDVLEDQYYTTLSAGEQFVESEFQQWLHEQMSDDATMPEPTEQEIDDIFTPLWRWPYVLTRLEFQERFTPLEQHAIVAAAPNDVNVATVMTTFNAAREIDVDSLEASGALDALIAAGCVAPERKSEILAPK